MRNIANVFLAAALLFGWRAYPADSRPAALTVTIRPAVSLTVQGGSAIDVKIRLAPGTDAKLWKSDECGLLPASGYVISTSGIYTVSMDAIKGEGGKVCLASSDGALSSAVSLPPGSR